MVKRSLWTRLKQATRTFRFGDYPVGYGPSPSNGSVGYGPYTPPSIGYPVGYPRIPGTTQQPSPFNPIGSYGTLSYAGYPSEDYLSSLRGRVRANVFDEMRRSDPQIKLCLNAVKNPIKGASWEIEKGEDTLEAQADADFIEQVLFKDLDFAQFISEALTAIDFGHSVFEPVEKIVLDHPKFGSYHTIKTLAFRSQRTLERFNLAPDTGELLSITQLAYGDLMRYVDIPAEALLLFSIDREGANYEGISMLRPCYGPWFRKNEYLKLNAIGIEKFAVPTPLAEVPEGKESSNQYANLIECLEAYTTHQNNYLTYPAGWKIILNANSYDPSKVEASIDAEDRRIVKAFLANFLELGMNTTGSYAMSNNLSDFFLGSLEFIAGEIERVINQVTIPRMIRLNKGERSVYPKLKHSNISDKAGKELAEILKFLGGDTQFIIPDDDIEDHLRKRYRLPKASKVGQRFGKPAPDQDPTSAAVEPTQPQPQPTTLKEMIRFAEARRKRIHGE